MTPDSAARCWQQHVARAFSAQPALPTSIALTFVVQHEDDSAFWQDHFAQQAPAQQAPAQQARAPWQPIVPVIESQRMGNFLGTLSAWQLAEQQKAPASQESPQSHFIAMLLGAGQRLSPITQAMGNRKPAVLTPRLDATGNRHLRMADIALLNGRAMLEPLHNAGFHGVLVRWGDEAIIPGADCSVDLAGADAVRFTSRTTPTADLARQKEWLVIDEASAEITAEISRGTWEMVQEQLDRSVTPARYVGVNLGSFAVTTALLSAATEAFQDVLQASSPAPLDWDPLVWMALLCENEEQWRQCLDHALAGSSKFRPMAEAYPDLFARTSRMRDILERINGRRLRTQALEFGEVLWIDMGTHATMRQAYLDCLLEDARSQALRECLGIPEARDERGNTIVGSQIPADACIEGSIIIDTTILDEASVIRNAVVVGGCHTRLMMPVGGVALFNVAERMRFLSGDALAYCYFGEDTALRNGERLTSVPYQGESADFRALEGLPGNAYERCILGNPASFKEAAGYVEQHPPEDAEARWRKARAAWLATHT
jgi:hypothetical protein